MNREELLEVLNKAKPGSEVVIDFFDESDGVHAEEPSETLVTMQAWIDEGGAIVIEGLLPPDEDEAEGAGV